MKTTSFTFTLGTCEGYFHDNSTATNADVVAEKYINIAEEVMSATGIFISAVVNPSKCVYSHAWGCPQGGEETFSFEGARNPSFCKDDQAWRDAVMRIASELKAEFKQSTVTVEFSEIDMEYLS